VTGDVTQIDLPPGKTSGLVESTRIIRGIPGIGFVYFDETDVVRHPLVQSIIRAYDTTRHGSVASETAPQPAAEESTEVEA